MFESRVDYLRLHDEQTGLLNKTALKLVIEKSSTTLEFQDISIICINLDHFALINENLGHNQSDNLIIEIAQKIKELTGSKGEVYRYDGDEFIIVLKTDDLEFLKSYVREISQLITRKIVVNGKVFILTASIGYDSSKRQNTVDAVFKNATTALYLAKKTRNTSLKYDPKMIIAQTREALLEDDLHFAVERNELELYYQPIYNVRTGKIEEAEALLRWNHSELGLISPVEFIPIAERTRLILPITDWVIHQACQVLAHWDQCGNGALNISINISFITIENRGDELITYIQNEIKSSGIKPNRLILEVTESSLIQDAEEVIHIFVRLKKIGLTLSLDDFGTGYSSFSYLKSLPLDIVKIDRSLIKNITDDPKGRLITESMITILHGLNLEVVAEGIEDEKQLKILVGMNVDYIQGFLFSKPVNYPNFENYYQLAKDVKNLPIQHKITEVSEKILYWHEEWNSGQPLIDEQHHQLMQLISKLENEVVLEKQINGQLKRDVNYLLETIKYHFDSEEDILKKIGYSYLTEHAKVHKLLYSAASDCWEKCLQNQMSLTEFAAYLSREVIWNHFLHEDILFFPFVSKFQPQNLTSSNLDKNETPNYKEVVRSITEETHIFQTILNGISTDFISTNDKDFDNKVNRALARCGKLIHADRVYIFEYDWQNSVANNIYEWCHVGITPQISELQNVPFDFIPDWVNSHLMGETINIPDVSALDPNNNLRQLLEPQQIKSLLTVPMMVNNVCFGFIGFDSVTDKHIYSEFERTILKEVSNVLLVAFMRKDFESHLH